MNRPRVIFKDLIGSLVAEQIWEYEVAPAKSSDDIRKMAFAALQTPDDFPPLDAAIVPGDRVALAVDPNIPHLGEVVAGVIEAIAQTEAGGVEVVVWDEATDETIAELQNTIGDATPVIRHDPVARLSVRYLGADPAADPIYLNRHLVDADFVLPIMAARPMDKLSGHDLTGVHPALSDSAARRRYRSLSASEKEERSSEELEISWLLGVQLLVSVRASASADVAEVHAGTLEAIGKRITASRHLPDGFPPTAPLVIASLDGDAQQQTWANAARAALAATRFVDPDGTIVLWTDIEQPLPGDLTSLTELDSEPTFEPTEDEPFPHWNPNIEIARALAKVTEEHRLLIHSRVANERIESLGIGVVGSPDELSHLTRSFPTCGVLRAAQFAGGSVIATND